LALSVPHCFKPPLLLGLDIGHAAIRMVELSQGADRRFTLERHARLALPAGMVIDRHIQHPAQLAEHIAALAARLGSRRKRVALALPADAVFTQRMQVPAHVDAIAREELVAAEAGGYLSVAPEQVRVDYQFSHSDPDDATQHEIVLAAARREQVEDRIAAVEAAGLTPAVLDIDLYAAHAACIPARIQAGNDVETADQKVLALLICDAIRTQIALFDRRQLLYHRELPGCGDDGDAPQIASAAMRSLPLAMPAGMTLSHIYVSGDCGASRLTALCRLLQSTPIQATQSEQSEQSEQSPIGCSVAQPFAAMRIGKRMLADDADNPTAYLVACGLAMRRIPS
jgi:type IV pilus assembly protein PilM